MTAPNPFAAGIAFCEGRFVPIEEARIPMLDWGFLRSDAVQDTVSVFDGAFFRLDDHLTRFERNGTSCACSARTTATPCARS